MILWDGGGDGRSLLGRRGELSGDILVENLYESSALEKLVFLLQCWEGGNWTDDAMGLLEELVCDLG